MAPAERRAATNASAELGQLDAVFEAKGNAALRSIRAARIDAALHRSAV